MGAFRHLMHENEPLYYYSEQDVIELLDQIEDDYTRYDNCALETGVINFDVTLNCDPKVIEKLTKVADIDLIVKINEKNE